VDPQALAVEVLPAQCQQLAEAQATSLYIVRL
jgi:hypothetical protein